MYKGCKTKVTFYDDWEAFLEPVYSLLISAAADWSRSQSEGNSGISAWFHKTEPKASSMSKAGSHVTE